VRREQLEKAQTHDELWNAAQLEMVHLGKMHGFMRMYWCVRTPIKSFESRISGLGSGFWVTGGQQPHASRLHGRV
jgi:hypothetical protein